MYVDYYIIGNSRLLEIKFWGSYTQIFDWGVSTPEPPHCSSVHSAQRRLPIGKF